MSRVLAARALRDQLDRLEAAGGALRATPREEIADALARAWGAIADGELAPGRAARHALPESTGLSLPMIAWALSTTFERAGRDALLEAARRLTAPPGTVAAPGRLAVLVLAGNVFTACVQPISLALLARTPLLVKASSKDDALPRLFHEALSDAHPVLGDACAVVTFPGGTEALEAPLLTRADVVSAYGGDATLASIRARLRAGTHFVAHGNGLGVGVVPALADGAASRAAADAFALDVAAYDQRGCMSPHAIFVERGAVDGAAFASHLADALRRLATELPRGALPTDVGAAQLQWRGVAAVRGALIEGDGWAVSHEPADAFRVSPGWRNVVVHDAPTRDDFLRAVTPLGVHLKTIGVAGDPIAIANALPPPLAPRVCEAGEMQKPSLLSYADGRAPWEGLQRFIEIDAHGRS